MARRLHDTERSAWWLLFYAAIFLGWMLLIAAFLSNDPDDDITGLATAVAFVLLTFFAAIWFLASLVGLVPLLVMLVRRGTRGPNRYGPDPLAPELDADLMEQLDRSHAPPWAAGGYAASSPGAAPADTGTTPGPVSRVYCPKCGKQRTAEARFCVNCGTEL